MWSSIIYKGDSQFIKDLSVSAEYNPEYYTSNIAEGLSSDIRLQNKTLKVPDSIPLNFSKIGIFEMNKTQYFWNPPWSWISFYTMMKW